MDFCGSVSGPCSIRAQWKLKLQEFPLQFPPNMSVHNYLDVTVPLVPIVELMERQCFLKIWHSRLGVSVRVFIEGISTFIIAARDAILKLKWTKKNVKWISIWFSFLVVWRCSWFWWSVQTSTGYLVPSSRCHKISKVVLIAGSSLSQWYCFSQPSFSFWE